MEYSSHYWQQLVPHKRSFMSEKVILQYIGFIKTHKKLIDSKKHIDKPRDRKLFYQIFHKLLSLESYVKGGDPVIKCEDEDRDFILRVRRGPLEVYMHGTMCPNWFKRFSYRIHHFSEMKYPLI